LRHSKTCAGWLLGSLATASPFSDSAASTDSLRWTTWTCPPAGVELSRHAQLDTRRPVQTVGSVPCLALPWRVDAPYQARALQRSEGDSARHSQAPSDQILRHSNGWANGCGLDLRIRVRTVPQTDCPLPRAAHRGPKGPPVACPPVVRYLSETRPTDWPSAAVLLRECFRDFRLFGGDSWRTRKGEATGPSPSRRSTYGRSSAGAACDESCRSVEDCAANSK
jgi:hypothetical protein